ncbi:MAG: hypothetical protein HOP09_14805 [Hyphomicrobium sp.]|nr:hypothetical protein [Hyphomicrobium sp.]
MSVKMSFEGRDRARLLKRGMKVAIVVDDVITSAWVVQPGKVVSGLVLKEPPPPGENWGPDFPRFGTIRVENAKIFVENEEEVGRMDLVKRIRELIGDVQRGLPWGPFQASRFDTKDLAALEAALRPFRER